MKHRFFFSMTLVMMIVYVSAQDQSALITLPGKEIALEEFLWMYNKNSKGGNSGDRMTAEEYLDSYIEFQLKVLDAENQGLDTLSEFSRELDSYNEQVMQSYLAHRVTREELIHEAYQRMQWDVHASHILFRLPSDATPEDTLQAWKNISFVREKILSGDDFEKVALTFSDDPAAEVTKGNLNYFTAFTMLYPVETAAYNTPVGSISLPFRSKLGYHIVKVHDRRPAEGKVKVAHVFAPVMDDTTAGAEAEAAQKIRMAYQDLISGRPFQEVVVAYSDDPSDTSYDGVLPEFGVGQMVPEFENASFGLENIDQFSRPFKTIYGWHIVRLLEKQPVGSLSSLRAWIEEKVDKGKRLDFHTNRHISQLKGRHGYYAFPEALDPIYEQVDSALLRGEWEGGTLKDDPTKLVVIGSEEKSVGEFVRFMEKTQSKERRAREARYYTREMFGQFCDKSVLDYEVSYLRKQHPEIGFLEKEFHDGMLLFSVNDRRVWSKALTDTAGLKAYHAEHRGNYMWGERTDAYIVTCWEGAKIDRVRRKYKKIQAGKLDEILLNEKYCDQDTMKCISLSRVVTESGVYPRVDARKGQRGPGPIYDNEKTRGFVVINRVIPPEPKEFEEVRGLVVSEYQKVLEKAWIRELKARYPVKVNKELLKGI